MNLTKQRLRLAAVALAAALAGAAAATAPAALADVDPAPPVALSQAADLDPYVQTHLMFGTVRPDGGPDVTDRQFRAFVDEVVTPRFPAGLTVDEVQGQYRDRHGTIERERSYELYLLYPLTEAQEQDGRIEEIRDAYTARFAQESVARVDEPARAGF